MRLKAPCERRGADAWVGALMLLSLCSARLLMTALAHARDRGRTLETMRSTVEAGRSERAAGKRATAIGHEAVVALVGARGLACSGTLIHPQLILTARQYPKRGPRS